MPTQPVVPVTPIMDPIATQSAIDPLSSVVVPASKIEAESTHTSENIPDWLKVPAAPTEVIEKIENTPPEKTSDEIISESKVIDIPETISESPVATTILDPLATPQEASDVIPEWIKNTTTPKEDIFSTSTNTTLPKIDPVPAETINPEEERLPDWLMSSLQTEKSDEVETPETKESEGSLLNLL